MEWIIIGLPALIYLGSPLLIKASQKVQGAPQLERVDPATWPQNVADTMRRHEHDLYNMGFEISERYALPNAMPDTHTIVTMLVHRKSGDKAMITAIWGNANGIWTLGTLYLEFSTRFEDGRCFDTMNSSQLSSFQTGPQDVKTQVPQVKEAADLYRVHRAMMKKHGASGQKIVYPPGGAGDYLLRIWREGFEEQVKFGRFVYHQSNDTFTPSFKGAYLMTWGLLWPMSLVRRAAMMKKAHQIWAEVQQQGDANESPFATSTAG